MKNFMLRLLFYLVWFSIYEE